MGVPVFEHCTEDVATETTVRLRCGHAFHGSCVAMALRTGIKCPMCRDDPLDEDEVEAEEFVEELAERITNMDSSMRQLLWVQSHDTEVQRKRAKLNRATKEFNKMIEELKHKRHTVVAAAVTSFRHEHRNPFDRSRKKLQKMLSEVRRAEFHALDSHYGTTAAREALGILDASGIYSVAHRITGSDVMRKHFWSV